MDIVSRLEATPPTKLWVAVRSLLKGGCGQLSHLSAPEQATAVIRGAGQQISFKFSYMPLKALASLVD
jgi:hypothetical protein